METHLPRDQARVQACLFHTVGIDISKDWLDAFATPEGRACWFSNDAAGFRKLIAWIGSEVDRIAYEPSGPFHRDLEETLLKAGLPLYAINPLQVRSFARSLGRRAKTDAVDVRMLATMAAAIEDLHPTQARSEGQRDLAELQRIQDALRKDRVATINRSKHLRTPVGKRVTKQRLKQRSVSSKSAGSLPSRKARTSSRVRIRSVRSVTIILQ